jgi:hypothetical protein
MYSSITPWRPTMQTTERPMTLEEFDALPETLLPCQLIEGRLSSPGKVFERYGQGV